MMKPLHIKMELKSLVICTSPICLDALLAFSLYQETNDLHVAHNELPLKRTDGVWHASQIRVQGPVKIGNVSYFSSLKEKDQDTRLFAPNGRSKDYVFIDTLRGKHKATTDNYNAYQSKDSIVHFFAYGEADTIRELLQANIFAIGKKHNHGYGSIVKIEVNEIEDDYSIYHPDFGVMRSLPCDSRLASEHGLPSKKNMDTELSAFAPPYYDTKRELCYVPSSIVIEMVEEEVTHDVF